MYETEWNALLALRCRGVVMLSVVALLVTAGCASGAASRARVLRTQPAEQRATTASAASRDSPSAHGDTYDQAVRLLASRDFETRSRAARTLVAAGDAALPALGRAGDLPVRVDGGLQVSATRAVVRVLVGASQDPQLLDHLGSPWSNVRREAAVELGRRDRWSAVPRLIDHLEDRDAEVRAASAEALRRVTNHFFGFRAEATVAHRRRTADRWRAWWSLEGRSQAQARAAAGPGRPAGAGGS